MDLPFRERSRDDFSDELQAHLDLETDRLIAEGLTPDAARAAAMRAFGNMTRTKERFFETSRWARLEQIVQDVRYAWRGLVKSPAFLATTVLTLGLGLALLTIAFTVVNAYVLRPFAIRQPDTLFQIVWHAREAGGQGFRWRDYDALGERRELFAAVIGEDTRFVSSNGRPVLASIVSHNYFDALGPAMALGRGLVRADADSAEPPVVLSDPGWSRLYGRDPSALGQRLDINGQTFTIVGILAPAFTGLGDVPRDLFVPQAPIWTTRRVIGNDPLTNGTREPDHELRETEIMVRLQPGVSTVQAESALGPLVRTIIAEVDDQREDVRVEVKPYPSPNQLTGEMIAALAPIFAAFALVLIAACANVSNVMLARAIARHREIAVRLSIGASRARIVQQLLTEGLVMALLAGVTGVCLAAWGLRLGLAAFFSTLPSSVAQILRLAPLTFDARVFLFALAVSAATTLLFALLPALQTARVSLTGALRGQGGDERRGSRLRNALVVGQVAVAIVFVITAVTIARNGAAVSASDLGFQADGVLSINVRGQQDELARPLADALLADPRVASLAVTSGNPLFNQVLTVAAAPAGAAHATPTRCTLVSPEFFPILHIPVGHGRPFTDAEATASARVAIVSDATAAAFWPGEDPIGKTLRIEPSNGRSVDDLPGYSQLTVVGTVRDIVTGMLMTGHDGGHIYLPMTSADPHTTAILMRARTDRDLDAEALQAIFRSVVTDPQVFEAIPLREIRDLQLYPLWAASWVGSLLGAVALGLSVSGLYGVLTYAISQRRKEIGIRMALGATARAVAELVLRQSLRLAGIGAAIGTAATFAVLSLLGSAIRLKYISLLDLGAFAAGIVLVLAATALAAYQPARRATRIDPSQALRSDA